MAAQPALRVVEGAAMDKSKALDAALSQIERAFGKGSIMRLGKNSKALDIETIPTGSLGLDIALGIGGLPRGRVVEIYGPESSGKTTLALHTLAEAQKKGGICAFIDAEHALDPVYARKLGVNAATESTMTTSTAPERTSMSVISSACSPVSGCEMRRLSTSTPSFLAYVRSNACSASTNAAVPPIFWTSATTCSVSVVLPEDSGP